MKKKALLTLACIFAALLVQAQSETVVNAHGRRYLINKEILGATPDGTDWSYILLHKAYAGTLLDDHHVMGKISAIRGNGGAWNRKWTVEVNTAAAYQETRGTLIAYNETASLVTLIYNSEKYVAAKINISSALSGISFTGFAANEALLLVTGAEVNNIQPFEDAHDDITLNGRTIIKSQSPAGSLVVIGSGADVNGDNNNILGNGLVILAETPSRHATKGAQLEFAIPSDANGGTWGQGRIITLAGNNLDGNAAGKMVIGTRRHFNKLQTGAQWYYGDDITIDENGNVGIGTLKPQAKLAVKGELFAQKVKVTAFGWSDFVFHPGYKLPSIYEVEQFVKQHQHLPDVPSEAEVKEKGIDVSEMNKVLLQKIEEQMLYIIELKKEVDALKKAVVQK